MKRILIILGMLVLAGLACKLPGQLTAAPAIEAAAPEPVQPTAAPVTEVVASEPAILSEIENEVAVRAKNEVDWKKVTNVELVSDGGSVRTQADSFARLDLPNGNVLLIGPDTIFELSNFDGQDWAIFLEQGGVVLEITADHLGRSVISTPIGIAWPTGSIVGVSCPYDPYFAVGKCAAPEPITFVACIKGSCAAAPHITIDNNPDSIVMFTDSQLAELDIIPLEAGEQLSIEKKTDGELTVSEVEPAPLDLPYFEVSLSPPEVIREWFDWFLINPGDTSASGDNTVTATDTATATPTVTATSEPQACTVTALVNLFCRPAPGYDPIDSFVPGNSAEVIAQSEFLWQVISPNFSKTCTVPKNDSNNTYVEVSGDCENQPEFTPLPRPTETPTPTATSTATEMPPPTATEMPTLMPTASPTP
jgi:hypothetical protein